MDQTKVCAACGLDLPIFAFGKNWRTQDGFRAVCKVCRHDKSPRRTNTSGSISAYNKWLNEYKTSCGCLRCGMKNPICLVLHHRDPRYKLFNPGGTNHMCIDGPDCERFNEFKAEIAKCDVLCANCHLIEHAAMREQRDSTYRQ